MFTITATELSLYILPNLHHVQRQPKSTIRESTTNSPTFFEKMPEISQDINLAQLKQSLERLPADTQAETAAHVLGFKKSPNISPEIDARLGSALMIGIDMEWYEFGPKRITEVGISVLPVSQVSSGKPIHALNAMDVHHLRLKNVAHMVNGERCPGHPEDFEFGSTSFVEEDEAKQALTDTFIRYDAHGELRPVVLCGHAIENDVEMLRNSFGVDLDAWGVFVLFLDTQVMAQEFGMEARRLMSLKSILAQYCVEEKYLHNAGNDVAQTMVAMSLLAGEFATKRGRYRSENQTDMKNVKALLQNRTTLGWGIALFCTNCDSTEHLVGQCPNAYHCTRCAYNAHWQHRAHTHPLGKCVRPAIPCQSCIESNDKKRQQEATSHYVEDCPSKKCESR